MLQKQLTCLLLLFISYSFAQEKSCDHKLKGKIIDDHDRQELAYASIYVVELGRGVTADQNGNYLLEGLCESRYTLRISHIGCEPVEITVNIPSVKEQNFLLEHHTEELKKVEVEGKQSHRNTMQPAASIDAGQLRALSGSSLGDVVSSVPGVTSLRTGAGISKPVIRGMTGQRVLMINNGIRLESQQWGNEHAPEIDPSGAEKVTVVKGASSVRYGADAIGGVILTEPGTLPDSAGITGRVNLSAYSNPVMAATSGYLQGGFNKLPLSWRASGNYRRAGDVRSPGYYQQNTGLSEYSYTGQIKFRKEKFSTEAFYSRFHTDQAVYSGARSENLTDLASSINSTSQEDTTEFSFKIDAPFQRADHETARISSMIALGSNNVLNVSYSRQYNSRMEFDSHGEEEEGEEDGAEQHPEARFELTTHLAEAGVEHNEDHHSGSIGVSAMMQKNTYEEIYFIPNYRSLTLGVYAIERMKLGKFEAEAGARYDYRALDVFKRLLPDNSIYSPSFTYSNLSASGGLSRTFSSGYRIQLVSSTGWRSPSVNEMFSDGLHHGAAAIEKGNEKLEEERAFSNSFELEKRRGKVSGGFSVYYNYIRNYIFLSASGTPVLTVRGAFPVLSFEQTDAGFFGADLYASYAINRNFSTDVAGSAIRARSIETERFLPFIPADRIKHGLTLKTSSDRSDHILRISNELVLRQNNFDPSIEIAPPPASYWLLGVSAGTEIKSKNGPINISLSAENILNKRYREYLDRLRYYSDAPGISIRLRASIPLSFVFGRKEVSHE